LCCGFTECGIDVHVESFFKFVTLKYCENPRDNRLADINIDRYIYSKL
jgi:hypothetical protein